MYTHVHPLVVEGSIPMNRTPSCSTYHLVGMKMMGRIFDWRVVKDVGRRELSSPREQSAEGQQGQRRCPRTGHTLARWSSRSCRVQGHRSCPRDSSARNHYSTQP